MIQEQIKVLQRDLQAVTDHIETMVTKAETENRELSTEELADLHESQNNHAGLIRRIAQLNGVLKHRTDEVVALADPVDTKSARELATAAIGGAAITSKAHVDAEDKGLDFARYARCLVLAKGNSMQAVEFARGRYRDRPQVERMIRAAVPVANTTAADYAGVLVDKDKYIGSEFIGLVYPETIVARLGLKPVPFDCRIPKANSGFSGYWVGEGMAKPVTRASFGEVKVGKHKVANISIQTQDLVESSDPASDALFRDMMIAALVQTIDATFIDSVAGSTVRPAGILNGVTPIPYTALGWDPAALEALVQQVALEYVEAKLSLSQVVIIMNPAIALSLAWVRDAFGNLLYPSMTQGTFLGFKFITSETVSAAGSSTSIIFVHTPSVPLAREPQARVDYSNEASVELEDAPTGATAFTSLWQNNLYGILTEWFVSWTVANPAAVQVISNILLTPLPITP